MSARYTGGLVYNAPGGWSVLFSGTNYLTVPSGASVSGTGDFTIECWIFLPALSATYQNLLIPSAASNAVYIDFNNSLIDIGRNNVGADLTASYALPTNTWFHIAFCRASSTMRIFVNGNQVGSGTVTTNYTASGFNIAHSSNGVNGYISNFRIVQGTAVYTSAFTPPVGALLPITNTSLLTCRYPTFVDGSTNAYSITNTGSVAVNTLNPFPTSQLPNPALGGAGNGVYTMSQYAALKAANLWPAYDPYYKNVTINLHGNPSSTTLFNTDASSNALQITSSGNPINSTLTPFTPPAGVTSYGSGYFNGSTDYLNVPSNANLAPGTGNFTFECWVYNTNTTWAAYVDFTDGAANALTIYTSTDGTLRIAPQNATSASLGSISSTALNSWVHIAVIRSSGSIRAYVNGTALQAATSNTMNFSVAFTKIAGTQDGYLKGYLSNVRYVNNASVYSISGSTITVPTSPLTAVSGTQLLTLQTNYPANNSAFLDSSTNNFVVTRNGNTNQGTFTPYGSNWSNYFDGSGDYLTLPSPTTLAFGTSDFTVEGWFNFSAFSAASPYYTYALIDCYENQSGAYGFSLGVSTSNNLINVGIGDTNLLNTPFTAVIGAWYHIAVSRSSGVIRLFVNGTLAASAVNSSNFTTSTTPTVIGSLYVYGTGYAMFFNGYASNVRVIKGTGLYTSSFNPSTAPLTAVTNTALLTCQSNRFIDNSTNAYAITRNGDVNVRNFGPFISTYYQQSVLGGSGGFDGSGDYLSLASNDAFRVDQGDWTIEGWMYMNSLGSSTCLANRGVYVSVYSFFAGTNGNTLYYEAGTGGWAATGYSSSANAVVAGQWNHVAFVRSGTSLYMYSNGTRVFSQTVASVGANVTAPMWVGQYLSGSAGLNGYMTDFRFVKGTAIYTGSTYTVPTAPLTAVANTSLLLSYTNSAINDNAMMSDWETVGNTQISTNVKKYGTGSLYFDGTGDYIITQGSPQYYFGTGNFTIEFWYYKAGTPETSGRLFQTRNGDVYSGISIGTNVSGSEPNNIGLYMSSNGSSYDISSNSAVWTVSDSTWTHICLVRNGSTFTAYKNGIAQTTITSSASLYYSSSDTPIIGGQSGTSRSINGYIDDFRITKGVARYLGNFTPPTSQLQDQ